jgi:hypothetical protein
MTTNTIELTEEFVSTIRHFVERSETDNVNHIIRDLVEGSYVDDEFGHLIFGGPNGDVYNESMDEIVLDVIETEIKRQLLQKFDR